MRGETSLATKVARAEMMKRVLIVLTTAMVTVLLVSQAVLITQIRATQQTGSPVLRAILGQQDDIKTAAKASTSTNDQILDCLTPEGECYKESQKRSAGFIASVNEITAYAAVCADRPGSQSLDEIRRCVADLIAASGPKP